MTQLRYDKIMFTRRARPLVRYMRSWSTAINAVEWVHSDNTILHVFTHGHPCQICNTPPAVGVVVAITSPSDHLFCEPLLTIGRSFKEEGYDKDSVGYMSIIEGLAVTVNMGFPNVDIINDDYDIISALKLNATCMVHEQDRPMFEKCRALARTFDDSKWLDTRYKYNRSAIEAAVCSIKCDLYIKEGFPSDNPIAGHVAQFLYSDFIHTYGRH